VTPADGPLLQQALDATYSLASQGLSRQAFTTLDEAQRKAPWALGHQRRFALVDRDRLLATAQRYDLSAVLDNRPVSICAIGAMWSALTADRVSHGRLLIDRLCDEARADGADIAMLFVRPHLASMVPDRFERLPLCDVEISVAESTRHGAPMTLVRSGEERDLAAIVAMGATRSAPFRFHLDRDAGLVKYVIARQRLFAGLSPDGHRQVDFVIAEEGITAAAYVVVTRNGNEWTIEECGDRDPSGARVGALLQALIAREPAEQRPVIRGWLPAGFAPPQIAIVASAPATDAVFARFITPRAAPLRFSSDQVLYWRNDFF
jgi:hypothetical protein